MKYIATYEFSHIDLGRGTQYIAVYKKKSLVFGIFPFEKYVYFQVKRQHDDLYIQETTAYLEDCYTVDPKWKKIENVLTWESISNSLNDEGIVKPLKFHSKIKNKFPKQVFLIEVDYYINGDIVIPKKELFVSKLENKSKC
jgi:hypothetical protein